MKRRASVVSLSFILPHPPDDLKKNKTDTTHTWKYGELKFHFTHVCRRIKNIPGSVNRINTDRQATTWKNTTYEHLSTEKQTPAKTAGNYNIIIIIIVIIVIIIIIVVTIVTIVIIILIIAIIIIIIIIIVAPGLQASACWKGPLPRSAPAGAGCSTRRPRLPRECHLLQRSTNRRCSGAIKRKHENNGGGVKYLVPFRKIKNKSTGPNILTRPNILTKSDSFLICLGRAETTRTKALVCLGKNWYQGILVCHSNEHSTKHEHSIACTSAALTGGTQDEHSNVCAPSQTPTDGATMDPRAGVGAFSKCCRWPVHLLGDIYSMIR